MTGPQLHNKLMARSEGLHAFNQSLIVIITDMIYQVSCQIRGVKPPLYGTILTKLLQF